MVYTRLRTLRTKVEVGVLESTSRVQFGSPLLCLMDTLHKCKWKQGMVPVHVEKVVVDSEQKETHWFDDTEHSDNVAIER